MGKGTVDFSMLTTRQVDEANTLQLRRWIDSMPPPSIEDNDAPIKFYIMIQYFDRILAAATKEYAQVARPQIDFGRLAMPLLCLATALWIISGGACPSI